MESLVELGTKQKTPPNQDMVVKGEQSEQYKNNVRLPSQPFFLYIFEISI